MARSYYHHPHFVANTTATSEKEDKRRANRCLRRKVNDGNFDLTIRDVSDIWDFKKDGKSFYAFLNGFNTRRVSKGRRMK